MDLTGPPTGAQRTATAAEMRLVTDCLTIGDLSMAPPAA